MYAAYKALRDDYIALTQRVLCRKEPDNDYK